MNNGKIENYINELSRSRRPFYKNSKAVENELLPGIVEVISFTDVTRIFYRGVIGWTFPKVIYVDKKKFSRKLTANDVQINFGNN